MPIPVPAHHLVISLVILVHSRMIDAFAISFHVMKKYAGIRKEQHNFSFTLLNAIMIMVLNPHT